MPTYHFGPWGHQSSRGPQYRWAYLNLKSRPEFLEIENARFAVNNHSLEHKEDRLVFDNLLY